MSTGLELADFRNPVSIWKPAPKGHRSALRRSRDFSKDADDKNGVVVDALPFKKRKFSSPSSSTPSIFRTQENVEAELEIDRKQRCRSADKDTRTKRLGKVAEGSYSEIDFSEDLSGIEILAAAACEGIFYDEENMTREVVDSSASTVLFEEFDVSGKDLASEDNKETSSLSSRLHWDLNTLMDAWEIPCDKFQDTSHMDVVDDDFMAGNGKMEMDDKCQTASVGIVHDAKSSSQNEEACVTRSIAEDNKDNQLSDCALRPCGEISSSDTQYEKIPCAVEVTHEQSSGSFVFREDSNKVNFETSCSISSDVENPCKASVGDEDKQLAQDIHKSFTQAPLDSEHANQARSASERQSAVSLGAKQPPSQVSSFENRSDSEQDKVDKLTEKAFVEAVDDLREDSPKVTHDPSDESYESGVYQNDKISFGKINSAEVQAAPDSQIEDGELRESEACHWEENDDENREDELLDYGSESDEERNCNMDEGKDQRIETCGTADAAKDESDSPITRTSDVTTDKDFLSDEGVGLRTSNNEEGSNLMHRKDAMMRRYDHGGSTYSRNEMVSDKATCTHLRSRSPGDLDSDRRYTSSHLGGYANGPRGMRSMEDHGYSPYDRDIGIRRFARFDCQVRGQFVNHSSNRRFEHSNGTRSSSNCMNRLYVRDNSPTSNIFRSSQNRGGFYKTALEDNSAYHSNRLAHRLGGMPRRERSISPVGRGGRGIARFDNHVRDEFPDRSLDGRFEHCSGRSSANGRLYVRDRDNSPTSTSFRRSPERGGFYKPVMEDNSAYPNQLAHRMGLPRRERSISPNGRGARRFARFDNNVRGQFVNRSSNSRFEHSNGTRYSANGMNRLYARDSSPSNCFRRSPQAFNRGERGGFYKPAMEGMVRRERSISPVGRGRSYDSESRSRGRPSYISGGEQIEGSRVSSRSPDFKSDIRMDRVKAPFQKPVTVWFRG